MTTILKTMIAAGLGVAALSPAFAGETSTSGEVTYAMTEPVPVAEGIVRMSYSGTLQATKDSDPFNGSTQNCTGIFGVDAEGNAVGKAGTCDAVDGDGDVWALGWWTNEAGDGSHWKVLWGSGKYAGMTGKGNTKTLEPEVENTARLSWEGTVEMK